MTSGSSSLLSTGSSGISGLRRERYELHALKVMINCAASCSLLSTS
jgi:hypothetical protein